jgi:hypothetical protein
VSLISAGCVFWLEALKPLFAATAIAALSWQTWLVWRRPGTRKTRTMWAIVAGTAAVNVVVGVAWLALQWRYR